MAKSGRYYESTKPKHLARSNAEGVSAIIEPPRKYRAPENTYESVRGSKLYRKGGTMATRVITRTFTPEIRIVNTRENVWREGL